MKDVLRWIGRAFMSRIGWVLAGLVLLGVGLDARADPVCAAGQVGKWTVTTAGPTCILGATYATSTAARSACVPPHGTFYGAGSHYSGEDLTSYNGTITSLSIGAGRHNDSHSPIASAASGGLTWACAGSQCPAAGTPVGEVKTLKGASDSQNQPIKSGLDYCLVSGLGVCFTIGSGTEKGTSCSGGFVHTGVVSTSPPATPLTMTGELCSASGKACAPNSPTSQCGTFNGEYICMNSIPGPGNCITTPAGTPVCTSDATNPLTNPPAPGASGVVTAPAATYTSDAGGPGGRATIANVWNIDGSGAEEPTTGEEVPDEEEEGEGDPGPLTLPELLEAKTFEESTSDFLTSVSSSPIISAVSSVSVPGGGACPTWTLDIPFFSASYEVDSHCAILDSIESILATIMLAFFSLVALRIALSA